MPDFTVKLSTERPVLSDRTMIGEDLECAKPYPVDSSIATLRSADSSGQVVLAMVRTVDVTEEASLATVE